MEYRKIKDLKKLAGNPRSIKSEDFKILCQSIKDNPKYFEARPLILSNRTGELVIIAGNQRYDAAKALKLKQVPTHLIDGLTDEKEKEITIRDNVQNGEWDMELLSGYVDMPLIEWGLDLPELLNAGEEETDNDAEPQIDRAEELNKIWQVKSGDLWQIGEHRLLCGDSTKAEDVKKVMGGERADMVFTDPPYGVGYADKNKYLNTISRGNHIQTEISGDHKTVERLAEDIIYPAFCRLKEILADRSSYYITAPQGGDLLMMMMMMMMQKAGLILRHMIIWVKNNHVLGRTDYNYKHEPILYGWLKVHDFYGLGKHKFSTWEINKPLKSDLHPTMKPVELVINAILNSCPPAGTVADLFGGSGTTMVSAENTGRKARMVELTENYCAVILERMKTAFPGIEIKRL